MTKVQGGTTTTTVPSTSNKISAVGGTSYTYDAAGNITTIGTNGYDVKEAAVHRCVISPAAVTHIMPTSRAGTG